MPHRTRPMTALLLFTGLNAVLVSTITPVYDFVCFLPYWERRVCFLSLLHVLKLKWIHGTRNTNMLNYSFFSFLDKFITEISHSCFPSFSLAKSCILHYMISKTSYRWWFPSFLPFLFRINLPLYQILASIWEKRGWYSFRCNSLKPAAHDRVVLWLIKLQSQGNKTDNLILIVHI